MLRRPPHWEVQTGTTQSVYGFAAFNLGAWTIGFGFDVVPTTLWFEFGPICVGFERREPPPKSYDDLPDWSGSLRRFVVTKLKLEIRVEYDLNIWRLGYIMADTHDHGLYVGPLNLQIEHDKLYRDPLARSDGLYEYANLYPRTTGLPMTVWISLRRTAGDDVRIRVNTMHGDKTGIRRTAVLTVRPTPEVLVGRLSPIDQQAVFEWMALNTDLLMAYWSGRIDAAKFVYRMKSINPSSSEIV